MDNIASADAFLTLRSLFIDSISVISVIDKEYLSFINYTDLMIFFFFCVFCGGFFTNFCSRLWCLFIFCAAFGWWGRFHGSVIQFWTCLDMWPSRYKPDLRLCLCYFSSNWGIINCYICIRTWWLHWPNRVMWPADPWLVVLIHVTVLARFLNLLCCIYSIPSMNKDGKVRNASDKGMMWLCKQILMFEI